MDTEYLRFRREETAERGVTQIWAVDSRRTGFPLGYIRWFGRWRQYAFFPEPETVFNTECLSDVREFIHKLMQTRSDRT